MTTSNALEQRVQRLKERLKTLSSPEDKGTDKDRVRPLKKRLKRAQRKLRAQQSLHAPKEAPQAKVSPPAESKGQ